jgi:hypothetical protein
MKCVLKEGALNSCQFSGNIERKRKIFIPM